MVQIVNKNGIEGYSDGSRSGLIVRGIIDSNDDIIIHFKSIFDITGGFDALDLKELYRLYLKSAGD